ncbi:hypothetical protein NA66_10972 [Burkholderia pyrrocinia]|uniref:Uncharacterized protein n=1 Tax=Burkholderia pyrrocinia TaxID=60550 RepID=A0A318HQ44_BURPY|nr:hypothetical protein NA66_10972 [Burkholderia pyrrocinia]SFW90345.1 hypothetical protein SAMN03159384_06989 [Burkholderia sp. NFACC33-1]SFW90414.1 hypothetical protein SAMN03159384_07009 [Burkholderia sp. NFACC33-1]SFY46448.1 hypothetical protein SAMN03159408_06985 [Burkholderia sp. NFPP32]
MWVKDARNEVHIRVKFNRVGGASLPHPQIPHQCHRQPCGMAY